jgi:hypothetical protein
VFALLLVAVGLSGNAGTKSGIYKNLDNTFDFKSLAGMSNRDSFVKEQIPSIAKASKDFFHLSSDYFVEGASMSLLVDLSVSFSASNVEPFLPHLSYEFSICLLPTIVATTLLCMPGPGQSRSLSGFKVYGLPVTVYPLRFTVYGCLGFAA